MAASASGLISGNAIGPRGEGGGRMLPTATVDVDKVRCRATTTCEDSSESSVPSESRCVGEGGGELSRKSIELRGFRISAIGGGVGRVAETVNEFGRDEREVVLGGSGMLIAELLSARRCL